MLNLPCTLTYRVDADEDAADEWRVQVLEKEGWGGLLGRGLKTRLLANGLQGLLFSVLWKGFEDAWNKREKEINAKA